MVQVVVFNVGKHVDDKDFFKFLSANKISYKHAKKSPKIHHAVMSFEVGQNSGKYILFNSITPVVGGAPFDVI